MQVDEGAAVGELVGWEGWAVGVPVGLTVREWMGFADAFPLFLGVGSPVGMWLGWEVGISVGVAVGVTEGITVGAPEATGLWLGR